MATGKLTRRALLRLGATSSLSIAVLGVAGCGPSAPAPAGTGGPAATAAPATAAAEIVFWPRSPGESQVVWEKILPIAKQMFPNLTVKLQAPAEDFNGKFLVAYAGGTAPDSGVTGLSAFRAFIGRKEFKSIQPYVDADSDVKSWLQTDYVPAAIAGYGYKGQLYAVPTVNEAVVLFYHKDAIVQAGLTPPREVEDDPKKWNWDTVVTYAKAINKGTGFRRERFGIIANFARNAFGISQAWGNLVYARGGRVLDADGENWLMTGTEATEAVQWIVDLNYKYDVQPDVGEAASANVLDRAFFQNGQMGMVVEGEYFSRYLWGTGKPSNGIPFNYDIAMMPFCPATGKRTNIYHGNGTFMTTQTKNADATWQWLRVVFTKDAQQVITNYWGTRGAHKGTYDSWLKSNGNGGPAGLNYAGIIKADGDTAPFPTTPYLTPEVLLEPTTRIMYDNVFQNKQPVPAGLAQIAQETTALLQKGKKELGAGS